MRFYAGQISRAIYQSNASIARASHELSTNQIPTFSRATTNQAAFQHVHSSAAQTIQRWQMRFCAGQISRAVYQSNASIARRATSYLPIRYPYSREPRAIKPHFSTFTRTHMTAQTTQRSMLAAATGALAPPVFCYGRVLDASTVVAVGGACLRP